MSLLYDSVRKLEIQEARAAEKNLFFIFMYKNGIK